MNDPDNWLASLIPEDTSTDDSEPLPDVPKIDLGELLKHSGWKRSKIQVKQLPMFCKECGKKPSECTCEKARKSKG